MSGRVGRFNGCYRIWVFELGRRWGVGKSVFLFVFRGFLINEVKFDFVFYNLVLFVLFLILNFSIRLFVSFGF